MKKMTKGAIVTGLGVALLLGGGGTLAVWNTQQSTDAGTIAAGDLNLTAGEGVWTSGLSGKAIEDISEYQVVPGDKLTYSQPVTVELVGDQMKAQLTVTGTESSTFDQDNIVVSDVTLTNTDGQAAPTTLTPASDGSFTAETSFEFKETTGGREDTLATYDFSGIAYKLEQQAPVPTH